MPRILAIELTEADARIVRATHGRKTPLEMDAAIVVSLDDLPKDETGAAQRAARVREAVRANHLLAEEAVVIVPKQSATIRRVTLPSTDPDELASMAVFEAEKIIPFNVERHIIGYSLAGKRDDIQGTDLIIAAIDEPVMRQWLAAIAGSGIEPRQADVSSTALSYAIARTGDDTLRKACILVVSVGMVHTDISFINEGNLVSTRSVMLGLRHLMRDLAATLGIDRPLELRDILSLNFTEPEVSTVAGITLRAAETQGPAAGDMEFLGPDHGTRSAEAAAAIRAWMGKLTTNVQRTAEFTQREQKLPAVARICLAGDGSLLAGLANALNAHLGLPTVRFNPLEKATIAAKGNVDRTRLPSFATAWGAVLRCADGEADAGLNLLPADVIKGQQSAERRLHYMIAGGMGLVAAAMMFLVLKGAADHRMVSKTRYEEYSEKLSPLVENVANMERQIDIIRQIRSDNAGALEVLGRVSDYKPVQPILDARIKIVRFEYTIGDEVRLEGHALEIQDISDFVRHLNGLEKGGKRIFASVEITNQNQMRLPRRDRPIYLFEITCTFPAEVEQ